MNFSDNNYIKAQIDDEFSNIKANEHILESILGKKKQIYVRKILVPALCVVAVVSMITGFGYANLGWLSENTKWWVEDEYTDDYGNIGGVLYTQTIKDGVEMRIHTDKETQQNIFEFKYTTRIKKIITDSTIYFLVEKSDTDNGFDKEIRIDKTDMYPQGVLESVKKAIEDFDNGDNITEKDEDGRDVIKGTHVSSKGVIFYVFENIDEINTEEDILKAINN